MQWTFTDSCAQAGSQVQIKLFDETNGGQYPEQNIVYVLPVGQTKNVNIACIPGAKVCFGGEDQFSSGIYWGVSLENNQSCTACCAVCGAGAITPQNLLCR
jgi:hypothetical protein